MKDCIFCKIGEHEASAKVILETDNVIAFDSIEPVAHHHVLIIPKEHIPSFGDLEEHHKDVLIEMAKVIQDIIADLGIEDGYKLVFNGGKYQSIKHIHWHLLAGKLEDEDDVLNQT